MKNVSFIWLFVLVFYGVSIAHAEWLVRPHAGIGVSSEKDKTVNHVGLRLLSSANASQYYGIEVTKIQRSGGEFHAVGIVLEQTLWQGFKMGIGTIGYLDFEDKQNPFGLVTNLGWEPARKADWKPFVTYRGDYVFSEKSEQVHSLSVGLGWMF